MSIRSDEREKSMQHGYTVTARPNITTMMAMPTDTHTVSYSPARLLNSDEKGR